MGGAVRWRGSSHVTIDEEQRKMALCGEESHLLYILAHRHRSPIGPLDQGSTVLFLRSLTALGPFPGRARRGCPRKCGWTMHNNRSIDPVQFNPIQSNPIQGAQAHHHSTALHVLPSALPADPAFRLLLTWANQQYALPCRHFHMEFGATSIRRDEPFTPTGPNQDKRIRYVKSKSRIGTQNY